MELVGAHIYASLRHCGVRSVRDATSIFKETGRLKQHVFIRFAFGSPARAGSLQSQKKI